MEQSVRIAQSLPKTEINGSKAHLVTLSLLIDALVAFGEEEHTGDWDLYLEIELDNGDLVTTQSGSPEIIFRDTKTQKPYKVKKNKCIDVSKFEEVGFLIEDEDEVEKIHWFLISQIKSIVLGY